MKLKHSNSLNLFIIQSNFKINCLFFKSAILLMVLLILTSSCDRKLEVIANTSNDNRFLSDALNFKGIPESPQDRSISSFCDLGSWHSFALPDDSKEFYGSFIGPFSMNRDNGIWLGKTFAKFILYKKNK